VVESRRYWTELVADSYTYYINKPEWSPFGLSRGGRGGEEAETGGTLGATSGG